MALAQDDSPEHLQAELANGEEQLALAQQQAQDLEAQAQQNAANERMIAVSDVLSDAVEEADVVDHAEASLRNDVARLKEAQGAP